MIMFWMINWIPNSYRQAQAAALVGIPKLKKLGVKTKRPKDFLAEMLKTDDHMKKVEENLNHKRQVLENSEKAKKLREMKKMGKKIQTEVLLNRQKEKRKMLDKIKQYKKGKIASLDDLDDGPSTKNKPKGILKNKNAVSGKRAKKNDMYGYGGKKKMSKRNDNESYADFQSDNRKRNGSSKKFGMKATIGKGKIQRPGKNRRQKIRSKQN